MGQGRVVRKAPGGAYWIIRGGRLEPKRDLLQPWRQVPGILVGRAEGERGPRHAVQDPGQRAVAMRQEGEW